MDTSAIQQAFYSGPEAVASLSTDGVVARRGNGTARGTPAQRDTAEISDAARNLVREQANRAVELHLSPEELQGIVSDA